MVNLEIEAKVYLWSILSTSENLEDLCVKISGVVNKEEGSTADIFSCYVSGTTKEKIQKKFNVVLKRIKRHIPIFQTLAMNEIFFYEKIFPKFQKFQTDKNPEDPFNSITNCYGTFHKDTTKVIALEDLRRLDYRLCDKTEPLTRIHIDFLVEEYGKFHAISFAMKNQQPEEFQELVQGLNDVKDEFLQVFNINSCLKIILDEIIDSVKDDFDHRGLLKLQNLKKYIPEPECVFKVIVHGDCWTNNFMFLYDDEDQTVISKVAMLDWQLSRFASPVFDVAFLIFAGIAPEDINDIDVILDNYYESFRRYSKMLGSNLETEYPLKQLKTDWKILVRSALLTAILPLKIVYSRGGNASSLNQNTRDEQTTDNFILGSQTGSACFTNRVRYLLKYAVENDFI